MQAFECRAMAFMPRQRQAAIVVVTGRAGRRLIAMQSRSAGGRNVYLYTTASNLEKAFV